MVMESLIEGETAPGKPERDWVDDLVGAIADPIIVFPNTGWEQDLPEPVKKYLPLARLAHLSQQQKGNIPYDVCCDSEALLYLYPRSMAAPMTGQWFRIYMYLFNQVMTDLKFTVTDDLVPEKELSAYDMSALNGLKRFIQRKKVEARKGKRKRAQAEVTAETAQAPAAETEAVYEQLGLM